MLKWGYDKNGDQISFTNALGATVQYVRDDRGREIEEIDPSPDGKAPQPVTQFKLDAAGQLMETISPDGEVTQYCHDGDGNLAGVIAPDPATGGAATDGSTKTTFAYDFDGNEIAQTGPDLNTTFNTFDDLNREVSETGPPPASGLPAPVTTWQLDAEGELLREVDPLGRAQTNQFDGLGRAIQSVSFAGVEQQFGYDVLSNLTSQSLLGVGQTTETTTHGYDALSREVLTTAPDGGQTKTGYDLANNVTSLVDPAGNSTTWQVDGLDRVVKDTNAGGTRTYGYDLAGEVTSEVDRDARLRTFQYDTLGQQTAENWLTSGAQATATLTMTTQGSGGYTDTTQDIVVPNAQGGTWSLTLEGETTGPIGSGVGIDSALDALPAVGAGTVSVVGSGTSSQPFEVSFKGALSGQDIPLMTAQSSLTYDPPVSVTEVTAAQPVVDAVDYITFNGGPSDPYQLGRTPEGEYPLGANATWVDVYYGSDSSAIEAALASLHFSIVSVTGTWPNYTITFNGLVDPDATTYSYTNSALDIYDGTVNYGSTTGSAGADEQQSVQVQPTDAGTFTLGFNGQTASAIAYNATAATVQADLAALSTIGSGNVSVMGAAGGPWSVTFVGAMADVSEPLLVADGSGLAPPPVTVLMFQTGRSGPDTVYSLVVSAAGGTYTLYVDGNKTAPIPYDATASEVQSAIASFAVIGDGSVKVTGSGSSSDPFVITFAGTLSGSNVTVGVDDSGLSMITNSITTGYNGDGQVTATGDSFSHYAMTYDGEGRVKTVDNAGTPGVPDVVLASGYDVMGDRTSLAATIAGTKDFLNNYSYDALAQMTSETQQGQSGGNAVAPKGISFGHDAIGDITSIARYTNLTQGPSPATDAADTTLGYSSLGQLTSIVHAHNGTTIEGLGYGYDTLSRVDSISSTIDGGTALGYDVTSQLVSATYTGSGAPPNDTENYDKNGNRTNPGYTIGAGNLITSDGTFNFAHDGEGNVTRRTRISSTYASDYEVDYEWDFRNRLTNTLFYDNNHVLTKQVHDVYDVFDQLIEQDVDPTGGGTYSQIVRHVWDGEGIVLDFNGQSQLTERYLNGPNTSATDSVFSTLAEERVNSLASPGTVTFNLLDHLGSTVDVVDAGGVLDDHVDYTVFGVVAHETNPSVHHVTGYAGGLPDPNLGWTLFGLRWYDAAHAVWTSTDPIGFGGGDTNLQRYVGNNPANETDPSGEAVAFSKKADADHFVGRLKANGAKGVRVVQIEDRIWVLVNPCDYKAVFKVVDERTRALFKGGRGANKKAWEERNNLVRAAGVFGNNPFYLSGRDTVPFSDAGKIAEVIKQEGWDSSCGLHVDIGGEGRHKDAINVNVMPRSGAPNENLPRKQPIPNLLMRTRGTNEDGEIPEIPDGSVDTVTIEGAPVDMNVAKESARILKPGGTIILQHPITGASGRPYARPAASRVVKAVGECAVSERFVTRTTEFGPTEMLETTITTPNADDEK